MMIKILSMAGALLASVFMTAPAYAGCDYEKTGYLYVRAACVQERSANPKNVCQAERSKKGKDLKTVYFISNVIADKGGNDRFPSSGFFSEIQIQHNVTENGRESHCYRTREEAEDNRRKDIADYKRNDYLIRHVEMRDH